MAESSSGRTFVEIDPDEFTGVSHEIHFEVELPSSDVTLLGMVVPKAHQLVDRYLHSHRMGEFSRHAHVEETNSLVEPDLLVIHVSAYSMN